MRTAFKRRKEAQDLSAFKSLIASPADLGSAATEAALDDLILPANGIIALSLDDDTVAGDITVTAGDRTIGIAGGDADKVFSLGFIERGKTIAINRGASAPAGALTIYVLDQWRRKQVIATGTFSS